MRMTPIALLLCACSGGGGGSSAPGPGPVPTPQSGAVSAPSPFAAACGGVGGTNYTNAEVEPHFAVDPRNPDHYAAAWQQDRWSNGSARGVVAAVTFDAGATWVRTQPAFTECAGGDFLRATDPWIAFAPDGTLHLSALVTTGGTFAEGSANAIVAVRSTDGGRTWSRPAALKRDGAEAFNDKETITADPLDARFVYATWDRLRPGLGGATRFARSADGGLSWEPSTTPYDPGADAQTIGNLVRVLPDGTLVLMAMLLEGAEDAPTSARVVAMRSTDRGASWSAPATIASARPVGTRDPATGIGVRDGSIVPQMAVGPDGSLHVVWQDSRFATVRDGIAYSRSVDGGRTWSAPVRVNGEAAVPAFTAQVHVAADGTVGVTYFDLRSDTPETATLLADAWLARSTDGRTWSEQRMGSAFDLRTAPLASSQPFLGDYMGLASVGSAFLSLHVRTTGDAGNRTDVVLARAATTGAVAVPAGEAKGFADEAPASEAVRSNLRAALEMRRADRGPMR